MLGNIEAANTKADTINVELEVQNEKILSATDKAKDIQSQTKIAMQYVKYFARQVYTDKILMCLIFLCLCGLVAVIVLKIKRTTAIPTDGDVIKKSSSMNTVCFELLFLALFALIFV